MIESIINQYKNKRIALYGIGTETERFLAKYGKKFLLRAYWMDSEVMGRFMAIRLFLFLNYCQRM